MCPVVSSWPGRIPWRFVLLYLYNHLNSLQEEQRSSSYASKDLQKSARGVGGNRSSRGNVCLFPVVCDLCEMPVCVTGPHFSALTFSNSFFQIFGQPSFIPQIFTHGEQVPSIWHFLLDPIDICPVALCGCLPLEQSGPCVSGYSTLWQTASGACPVGAVHAGKSGRERSRHKQLSAKTITVALVGPALCGCLVSKCQSLGRINEPLISRCHWNQWGFSNDWLRPLLIREGCWSFWITSALQDRYQVEKGERRQTAGSTGQLQEVRLDKRCIIGAVGLAHFVYW